MDETLENRRQFLQRQFAAEFKALGLRAAPSPQGPGRWEHDDSYRKHQNRTFDRRQCGLAVMSRLGFMFVGSGHFSDVFEHTVLPGYVVKVSWIVGDMGRMWAKWCDDSPGPYLPEIIAPTMHGNIWTCWMPRYRALDSLSSVMHAEAMDQYAIVNAIICRGGTDEEEEDEEAELEADIVAPGLRSLCFRIVDEFEGYGTFDMHSGNAMWDEDNSRIVITDPLSFPDEEYEA